MVISNPPQSALTATRGPVVQASRRGEGRGQLRVRLNIDIIQQQPSLSQCRPAVPAQIAAHHPPTAQLVGQQ